MPTTLDSIVLFVKDVAALKHFYTSNFLFTVVEEIANEWVLLQAGGCYIGLHKIGANYEDDTIAETNVKLVFAVDDIAALQTKLQAQQVTIGEIKTYANYPFLLCDGKDAEGNVFQLKQAKQ
ncbi:MAG: VOC family protein [Flavobacterium sp.]|nr:VOC family protein [Flavobacterium sp.]